MKDGTSITRLAKLHPACRATFQKFIEECERTLNITLRIVQGLRTFEEQNGLFKQSRDGSGRPWVTNAKGGESFHNYGMAVDLGVLDPTKPNGIDWGYDYTKIAAIAAKYGITWGGTFKKKDADHFELNFGKGPSGYRYFLDRYNAGKMKDGYVTIE